MTTNRESKAHIDSVRTKGSERQTESRCRLPKCLKSKKIYKKDTLAVVPAAAAATLCIWQEVKEETVHPLQGGRKF